MSKDSGRQSAFARALVAARVKKGWSQSDLARQVAMHMPDKQFGRDNISKYEMGSTTPLPVTLAALAKASPDELFPGRGEGLMAILEPESELSFRQIGGTKAHLRVNQELPLDVALKIIALLGEVNAADR